MNKPDFTDARTKLDRARGHIAEAKGRISSYLASDFYAFVTETDKTAQRVRFVFKSLHQPDKMLNAVIGDAIGNLRSTLDYAAVAMVSPVSGQSEGIYFPFADDASGFKGETKAKLGLLSQTIQQHVIDKVQAYRGGAGEPLWAVNKLRNLEKHRLLVATTELAGATLSFKSGMMAFDDLVFTMEAGDEQTILNMPFANVEFTKKPTLYFEVRLHETGILEHAPAITFLNEAADLVQTVLDALEVL